VGAVHERPGAQGHCTLLGGVQFSHHPDRDAESRPGNATAASPKLAKVPRIGIVARVPFSFGEVGLSTHSQDLAEGSSKDHATLWHGRCYFCNSDTYGDHQ
jgi:hypothetical protein